MKSMNSYNCVLNLGLFQLTCLHLAEDLALTSLVPYAAPLAQLCSALLTFDESEVLSMPLDSEETEGGVSVAPSYLFHSTDASARLEFVTGLLARWLPRGILLLASEQPDGEFERMLTVSATN